MKKEKKNKTIALWPAHYQAHLTGVVLTLLQLQVVPHNYLASCIVFSHYMVSFISKGRDHLTVDNGYFDKS
jgi:hypothetical protein